jgi:hypothetical protein
LCVAAACANLSTLQIEKLSAGRVE